MSSSSESSNPTDSGVALEETIVTSYLLNGLATKAIDLENHSFKACLYDENASFSFTSEDYTTDNELPEENGYKRLDKDVTGKTITHSGNYSIFDIDQLSFSINSGLTTSSGRYCALVHTENDVNKYIYVMKFSETVDITENEFIRLRVDPSGLIKFKSA